MTNPYKDLPPSAFWRSGVVNAYPDFSLLYEKKFHLRGNDKIAAAGSCFAQHISKRLRANKFDLLDVEPAPEGASAQECHEAGYNQYSARFGNIYTVQQLLQLAKEAFGDKIIELPVWEKDQRFFDALRPGVVVAGYSSHEEVVAARKEHLSKVRELFLSMDVLIFTMGLTEHWYDKEVDAVLPIAPGAIAGTFNPMKHEFRNASTASVVADFNEFQRYLWEKRDNRVFRCILTVSPVPLTATYVNRHVLLSTVESKAILRAAAADLSRQQAQIDYFPSYEIVTHPASCSSCFEDNLRSVRPEAVSKVMETFFSQHRPPEEQEKGSVYSEEVDGFIKCEEEGLEILQDDK